MPTLGNTYLRGYRQTTMNQISEIRDYLYLSGMGCLTSQKLLQIGITCVIDAANIPGSGKWPKEIEHVKINVADAENSKLDHFFADVIHTIHRHRSDGGKTLVHCAAGISRSATLCIVYLLTHDHLNLRDAYLDVRRKRSCVCPNNGFWVQMIDYERRIQGGNTVEMTGVGKLHRQLPDVYLNEHKLEREHQAAVRRAEKMDSIANVS